jgi:hypothetical protein
MRLRSTAFAQALCLACGFAGASANAQSRFSVSATATLTPDAPPQHAAGFRLQAQLAPVRAPAQAPPAQTGARFSLVATTNAFATACSNDTIFRNDFDADGL